MVLNRNKLLQDLKYSIRSSQEVKLSESDRHKVLNREMKVLLLNCVAIGVQASVEHISPEVSSKLTEKCPEEQMQMRTVCLLKLIKNPKITSLLREIV